MTKTRASAQDRAWLRAAARPEPKGDAKLIRAVDLFSGCGGMSLGLAEGARRVGWRLHVKLAVDRNPVATDVYTLNIPNAHVVTGDVVSMLSGKPNTHLNAREQSLADIAGQVDFLLGGPPCEGHSDLNNHTRRHDSKNGLYLKMARAAEVFHPKVVVIENVPPALLDSKNVVDATWLALEKAGYSVHGEVLDLSLLGVPQRRKRFILIASRIASVDPFQVLTDLSLGGWGPRDVRWAIGDLERIVPERDLDRASRMSPENEARVAHLFREKMYDLPNEERPHCHQDGKHTYKSMYGRLRWDRPAQTVTTGFGSMGQGRYVHPSRPRTITPHEAARLQTFPDWFDWSAAQYRTSLATLIGNAVPPLMMVRLGEILLRRMRGRLR